MGIEDLRKRLKPVPVSTLVSDDAELDKVLGREKNSNDDLIKIRDGMNIFRLYPPHEPIDKFGKVNPFAEPLVVTYVPAYVNEKDDRGNFIKDANGAIKKKLSRKPVFNAVIHGKRTVTGQPATKDLVEEFIKIAVKNSQTMFEAKDEEKRKKYLEPIYGVYSPDPNKRVEGIMYSTKWTIYVDLIEGGVPTRFGRIEIGKSVKNDINSISAIESNDEPMGTDPFTDLDEGRCLKILYNSKATQAADYYTVSIDSTTEMMELSSGKKVPVLRTIPITDERLEIFAKAKPLSEIYRNVFSRRDFDIQLTGLKMLDSKYELCVFDTPEFQAIAEDIVKHYPIDEAKEEKEVVDESKLEGTTSEHEPLDPQDSLISGKTLGSVVEKKELSSTQQRVEETDMFSSMTRDELKEYSIEAMTGILLKPTSVMSDDDLRNELRVWRLANQNQFEALLEGKPEGRLENISPNIVEEVERGDPKSVSQSLGEKTSETPITTPVLSAKDRLEALKKKQQGIL